MDLDDLADGARRYLKATRAPNTLRAYTTDWADFTTWCDHAGLASLPADPSTVALYLVAQAKLWKPSTIGRRLAAISTLHQRAGFPSPTTSVMVREIMTGIRRTIGTSQKEAAPLTVSDLRRISARLPDTTLGLRDRVALLTGFSGALRRSELVGLDVEDLTRRSEGVVVTVRRSKTDQEASGRQVALPWGRDPDTCPVRALDTWMSRATIDMGPLLRAVDRHGNVSPTRLAPQAVNTIVKRAVASIGLDPMKYSGHSLRAGFATEAAANGASERAIANQTGHGSMDMLRRYVRHGTVFVDNAATTLGL